MPASVSESSSSILKSIRSSNLNYSCTETPYSLYITVRKSWSRQHHPPQVAHQQLSEHGPQDLEVKENEEMLSLRTMLEDVKAQLKAKVDASTAEVINHNREAKKLLDKKDDEIKALKSSIRNGTA